MQILSNYWKKRSREEIEAVLWYFDAFPKGRRHQKKYLAESLVDFLESEPEKWLSQLPEADLRLLSKLVANGPSEAGVAVSPPLYPLVTEYLHIVSNDGDMNGYAMYSLPEAVYHVIAGKVDDVIRRMEKDGSFTLEHLLLGVVNYYGVVTLRFFLDCVFPASGDESGLQDFSSILANHPAMRLYREFHKDEIYMVSPFVRDVPSLLDRRKTLSKGLRRFAKANRYEFEDCGTGSPYCSSGKSLKAYADLTDYFRGLGFDEETIDYTMNVIWLTAQSEPGEDTFDAMMAPLVSNTDIIPDLESFLEGADRIVTYANLVPRWLLKGHGALETGRLLYTVPENFGAGLFDEDETLSAKSAKQILDDALLDRVYGMLGLVRPVDPDEPCPCGSRLSYRICHGKVVS
ncbi:MAG: SEC-C domain-containing protein [Bacteroidales bacterium]|nr:SEC-C domain-containing protein [Bacteroidales bacterium]